MISSTSFLSRADHRRGGDLFMHPLSPQSSAAASETCVSRLALFARAFPRITVTVRRQEPSVRSMVRSSPAGWVVGRVCSVHSPFVLSLSSHSVAPHHCLHSPHVLLCPLRSQPCACMCLYEPGPLLEPPRSQSLLPLLSHAPPPPPLLRPRQMRALSPHSCCPSASKSGSVVSSRL